MERIVSTLKLENVQPKKLKDFIKHWQLIKDLPCENVDLKVVDSSTLEARLEYSLEIFDKTVSQFMTVLFGELSFITSFGKVTFTYLELPKTVFEWFSGPKFGAEEVLKRFGVSEYPMLVAIIKPSLSKELSIEKIDEKIRSVLDGGFHGVKDDEMQGNLSFTSLKERVGLAKKHKKYIPTLNLDSIEDYKKYLAGQGSENIAMVLVNASTIGFSLLHEIRKITDVPLLSHVALQGVYQSSFSPKVFALLHRLFGCDAFTNPIGEVGYFNVNRQEEKEMALEFTKELPIKRTLPLLTGGARLQNLTDIISPYEQEHIPYGVVFGSLIFASDKSPTEMAKQVVTAIATYKARG